MTDRRTAKAHDIPKTGGGSAAAMAPMRRILIERARTLDALFAEMARQASDELPLWPGAARIYARLALRAQSNCREVLTIAYVLAQREDR